MMPRYLIEVLTVDAKRKFIDAIRIGLSLQREPILRFSSTTYAHDAMQMDINQAEALVIALNSMVDGNQVAEDNVTFPREFNHVEAP